MVITPSFSFIAILNYAPLKAISSCKPPVLGERLCSCTLEQERGLGRGLIPLPFDGSFSEFSHRTHCGVLQPRPFPSH